MPRAPAKTPSFTKEQVAKAIKADDAKRRSKSAAKRAAKKAPLDALRATGKRMAEEAFAVAQADTTKKEAEQAAYIAALKIDAQAVWDERQHANSLPAEKAPDSFVAEYVAKELDLPADAEGRKQREQTYFGPMLALRTAAKTYVKAANGILCNGDWLAQAVGHLTRENVCKALIAAMKLEGNPYLHLNPGQQSMNLRNKARQMVKAGTLAMVDVAAAVMEVERNSK